MDPDWKHGIYDLCGKRNRGTERDGDALNAEFHIRVPKCFDARSLVRAEQFSD
jgi:hypothetical protein